MAGQRHTQDMPGGNRGQRFSALRWERGIADQFLVWRRTTGAAEKYLRTFGEAITRTLRQDGQRVAESGELASKLKPVLASCDELAFDNAAEAIAYAALHLLVRYDRVTQILEYLMRIGRLPLRTSGARVLEVGAGPAPALYATRDFYVLLLRWPGARGVAFAPLATFDTLDRGHAWDPLLHHLSETLITVRDAGAEEGSLAFGRSILEFEGLEVARRHHEAVAQSAARIVHEFDTADEPISAATAWQMAYEEGVVEPSAYDIVYLCYFLTQTNMPQAFRAELGRLAHSLTPGGVLIIVGGTGQKYQDLYVRLREITSAAGLVDMSPPNAFSVNDDPNLFGLLAKHVRENVRWALESCPAAFRTDAKRGLPGELLDNAAPFRLPQFRFLVFVRQGPRRGRSRTARRS